VVSQATESGWETLAPGLIQIDTGYLRASHTACYLVIDAGRAAIIDTGVGYSAPRILDVLTEHGLARSAVDWVIPTHVHLDHAGGAGALMDVLPEARLGVHPSGASHMVDPSRLEAGVRALYGDAFFDREYAPISPVDERRVVPLADGEWLSVGERRLEVIHTPGHAWHQLGVFDLESRALMAGDAFGASYPGYGTDDSPFLIPVVPPPQFAPEAYRETLTRIVALDPCWVAPAHFPVVKAPQTAARYLRAMLDAAVEWAWTAESRETLLRQLTDGWAEWLPADCDPSAFERDFGLDLWLTAEGLWYWREKAVRRRDR
jgi:glyoxylase-like metal-dependent hydrolase (beta-lactamase superfamily II)